MVRKITYSNKIKNIIVLLLIVTIGYSHPVVQNLDIERFMGRWYVISIIPNWFEDGKNAYDDYVLNPDGTVGVTYYAIKNGEVKTLKQKGYVNKDEPARWEVQIVKPYIPFYRAPYEVIILEENYNYMVVGYPNNSLGWIMSRTPVMDELIYKDILNQLENEFGYDQTLFEMVIHDIKCNIFFIYLMFLDSNFVGGHVY